MLAYMGLTRCILQHNHSSMYSVCILDRNTDECTYAKRCFLYNVATAMEDLHAYL